MSETRAEDTAELLDDPETAARIPRYRTRVFRWCSWTATAVVGAYALVRLFGLETGWILTTTIAFVPYAAAATLLGAALQTLLRHWRAALVTTAAGLAMAAVVVPRAFPDERPPADGAELNVMSVNTYGGGSNLRYIVDLVDRYEPDLLSIQELTPAVYDRLVELGLEERMPHVVAEPADMAVGTGLFSLHPLERLESFEPDGIFYQIAAEATLPDSSKARFLAVHTAAPARPDRVPQWEADFSQLPRPSADVPWILAGDFNATLDHSVLRETLEWGYTDAADVSGKGLGATWRPVSGYLGGLLRPPAVTLDHVLVDERIAVHDFEVFERNGSDHSPILATIQLPE